MSTTDELLEEMLEDAEEYATPVTDDDLQFWIDEHLRVISIPKNGVVAGVEGDKNVNKIKFGMNRYYHGFDMSTFSGRILYSNAKGNKNYYNITDMQASGSAITFSWLVDADAVQYMGKTAFVVYLFKTQGSELRQKFYSTLATLKVLEGMEVDSAVPVEKQTDIIERMKEEISAYAEEVKKSLPADYTAMTEQVSSLKEELGELDNRLLTTNATINIFNKRNVTSGENIDVSNGKTRFDDAWSVSEYIDVGSNDIFTIIGKLYQNENTVCFFDENKNFISGLTINYPSVFNGESIPTGTKYIRFNIRTYQDYNDLNNVMFTFVPFDEPYHDTDYIPFNGPSNTQIADIINRQTMPRLELLVLGDSYSENTDGWLLELSKIINFSAINNYAVSGATLKDKYADRSTYPYSINPKLSDGSGNFNTISSQVEQILHEIATGTNYNNPDLIIIQGGTNDYPDTSIDNYESQFWTRKENVYIKSSFGDDDSSASLGTYFEVTKLDDTDRTTFAGAMHYIYGKLHEYFPKAKFIFVSPSGLSYGIGNNIEYIKKTEQMSLCCEFLCQPLVEWAKVGRMTYVDRIISGDGSHENPYIAQNGCEYSADGLHPKNGYPCKLLALPVASEIRKYFATEILLN